MTIDFSARVGSMATKSLGEDTSLGVNLRAEWGSSAALTASFANKQTARSSNTEEREFSMKVFVKAVQADMPEGTQRLIDALVDAISKK
jgi:hypothetical protein